MSNLPNAIKLFGKGWQLANVATEILKANRVADFKSCHKKSPWQRNIKNINISQNEMREKSIENRLVDEVEEMGGWAVKFWPQYLNGFPDRIIMLPGGRIWFVELKAPGKKVKGEGLQGWVHRKLRALGFKVLTISTINELENFIDEIRTV